MLRSEITAGMTAHARVGARIAPVRVVSATPDRTGRFECRTLDTGRPIRCTAARLRPLPGSPEDSAARDRAAARAAVRGTPRPFSGATGDRTVPAEPVPGVLARVGAATITALSEPNEQFVGRIVDALHVAEAFPAVARAVRRRVGASVVWGTIPRSLRRGLLHAAAVRHAGNRSTYRAVMGHAPLPSEGMVARAVGAALGLPYPR